jgi:hypothetical protein
VFYVQYVNMDCNTIFHAYCYFNVKEFTEDEINVLENIVESLGEDDPDHYEYGQCKKSDFLKDCDKRKEYGNGRRHFDVNEVNVEQVRKDIFPIPNVMEEFKECKKGWYVEHFYEYGDLMYDVLVKYVKYILE